MANFDDIIKSFASSNSDKDQAAKELRREASKIEKNLIEKMKAGLDFAMNEGDLFKVFGKNKTPILAGQFQAKFVKKMDLYLTSWARNQEEMLNAGFAKSISNFPESLSSGKYQKEYAKFTQLNADTANLWQLYNEQIKNTDNGINKVSKTVNSARRNATASKTNLAHLAKGGPIAAGITLGGLFGGPIGAIVGGGMAAALIQGRFGQHLGNLGRAGAGGISAFKKNSTAGLGMGAFLSDIGGPVALGLTAAAGAGYELYKLTGEKVQSRNRDLEAIARTGRIFGMTNPLTEMTHNFGFGLTHPKKGIDPGVAPALQQLGLITSGDVSSTGAAYGMGRGSNRAIIMSAALANNMTYMGFQSKEEWANYLGKIASMGLAGGAGLTAVVGTLSKSVEAGVKAGIRPEDTYNAINKTLAALEAGGSSISYGGAARFARIGANSDIMGLRSGSINAQAAATAQGNFQNILGNPLLMNEAISTFGSVNKGNMVFDSGAKINRWLTSIGSEPKNWLPQDEQYFKDVGGNPAYVLPYIANKGTDATGFGGRIQLKAWSNALGSGPNALSGHRLRNLSLANALISTPDSATRNMEMGLYGRLNAGGAPTDAKSLSDALTEAYKSKGIPLPTMGGEVDLMKTRKGLGEIYNKDVMADKAVVDSLFDSFSKLNNKIREVTQTYDDTSNSYGFSSILGGIGSTILHPIKSIDKMFVVPPKPPGMSKADYYTSLRYLGMSPPPIP